MKRSKIPTSSSTGGGDDDVALFARRGDLFFLLFPFVVVGDDEISLYPDFCLPSACKDT